MERNCHWETPSRSRGMNFCVAQPSAFSWEIRSGCADAILWGSRVRISLPGMFILTPQTLWISVCCTNKLGANGEISGCFTNGFLSYALLPPTSNKFATLPTHTIDTPIGKILKSINLYMRDTFWRKIFHPDSSARVPKKIFHRGN